MSYEDGRIGGLLFVAVMFIGVGFIIMALTRAHRLKFKVERTVDTGKYEGSAVLALTAGSIILALIGIIFICLGMSLALDIELPVKLIGRLVSTALGLIFIALALKIFIVNKAIYIGPTRMK